MRLTDVQMLTWIMKSQASKRYYTFRGSLTTPPCSEGVRFLIGAKYAKVLPSDIADFIAVEGFNNRGPQPRNGRKVLKSW